MKKLIYFLIPLFLFIPKVHALDYVYTNRFVNQTNSNTSGFFIDSYQTISGKLRFEVPKDNAHDYLLMTYCTSSSSVNPGLPPNDSMADYGFHFDTGVYCNTDFNSVAGTIKHSYFTVKQWTYSSDNTYAYIDINNAYWYNSSQYSNAVKFYGFSVSSSLDVSMAILTYLKSNSPSDYSSILNNIQNNQGQYQNSLNSIQSALSSGNQNLNDIKNNINITNDKLDQVNDTLSDDTIDSSNTSSTLEDLSEDLPTNSVISDLLLLPVRLFQNIVNSINGSCTSFNLGSLYGSNLILPCINIETLIGSTLWSVIDILFCGAFILVIRKKFVDIFENLTELRNGGNAVE